MSFFLRQKGLEVVRELDPVSFPSYLALSRVEIAMLRSICFNIVDNAVKYTPPGAKHPITVTGEVKGEWVIIKVANWGIGVPPGEESLIFEKEKQGSNAHLAAVSGHGMGLYIASVFAERLQGRVELVRSHEPTVFAVKLPMSLARYEYRGAGSER